MGINKGKLKREKKELERLFNLGRHGEFLQAVEREGLAEAFPQETGKAWRALVRSAFTTPEGMTAFFLLRRRLPSPPELPDLRFLELVERFLDGDDVAAEAAALKDLTPASQSMARQLLRWEPSATDTREIEALFAQFVNSPEKVSHKQLEAATSHFFDRFDGALQFLPLFFELLRKGNLKGAVAKKRRGIDLDRLSALDQEVKEAAKVVPVALMDIFTAPLMWQLARLYENYCGEDNRFALELATATPWLSSQLAGNRWEEVAQQLDKDDLSDRYDDDPKYVRKKIAGADFPEKVRLLGSLASTLHTVINAEDDDDFDLDFDDDDDDESDPWDDTAREEREKLIRADYLLLYKEVLAEIGRKRQGLTSREERELDRIMGEFLERDFTTFFAEPGQCIEFLQATAKAGLLNTKLALASLFIARPTGNRALRERAEQALTTLPLPVKGDIQWLFKYFGFLSYPAISAFAPLIKLVKDDELLLGVISDLVAIQVTRTLVENQLGGIPGLDIFKTLMKATSREMKQEMTSFRNDLKNFSDIAAFSGLFLLAESYPDGVITESGFKKILADQYARSGITGVIRRMKLLPPPPPWMEDVPTALLGMELQASLELLKQHLDDLRSAPLESLVTLVEILEQLGPTSVEAGFLVRLSNLLQERQDGGEKEVGALGSRIDSLIRSAAGKTRRRGRRR